MRRIIIVALLGLSACSMQVVEDQKHKWKFCTLANGDSFKFHTSTVDNAIYNPITGFISYEVTDTEGWTRIINTDIKGLKCKDLPEMEGAK